MNMRTIALALFAASLGWSASALAKDEGFYIGAGAGIAGIELEDEDFDESDFAWKVFAGYQFNGLFAVEGGYRDLGTPDDNLPSFGNTEVDPTGIDIYGVFGIPLGPVRAFGKAGVIFWDADIDTEVGSGDDDGSDLGVGVGLEFEVLSIALRGEVEYFDIEDGVYMATLGATFTF